MDQGSRLVASFRSHLAAPNGGRGVTRSGVPVRAREGPSLRDGNKRIAFLAAVIFLGLNGHNLAVEEADVVTMIRAAAAGEVSEGDVARWIRAHLVRRK